jgi:nickel transport protein
MKILITLGLITVSSISAYAHKLHLLAYYDAGSLNISSYYADGSKCTDCAYTVKAADGTIIFQDKLNEKGEATVIQDFPIPFTVHVDAGMGHSAKAKVDNESPEQTKLVAVEETSAGAIILNDSQIRNIIRQELSKQTTEITAVIETGRSQTDKIIAGLGYLFGIFGIFVLFKKR